MKSSGVLSQQGASADAPRVVADFRAWPNFDFAVQRGKVADQHLTAPTSPRRSPHSPTRSPCRTSKSSRRTEIVVEAIAAASFRSLRGRRPRLTTSVLTACARSTAQTLAVRYHPFQHHAAAARPPRRLPSSNCLAAMSQSWMRCSIRVTQLLLSDVQLLLAQAPQVASMRSRIIAL